MLCHPEARSSRRKPALSGVERGPQRSHPHSSRLREFSRTARDVRVIGKTPSRTRPWNPTLQNTKGRAPATPMWGQPPSAVQPSNARQRRHQQAAPPPYSRNELSKIGKGTSSTRADQRSQKRNPASAAELPCI